MSTGCVAEAITENPRGSEDPVTTNDGEVFVFTGFVEFLDCFEGRDEVWSESISPFPIMSECNDLPRLAAGRPEDACVTFEICHVLLITKELR